MTRMLTRKDSESFVEDINNLRSARNTKPEYKGAYEILYMIIAGHIEDDPLAVINSHLIPKVCDNLDMIVGNNTTYAAFRAALNEKFEKYFKNKSSGQVIE